MISLPRSNVAIAEAGLCPKLVDVEELPPIVTPSRTSPVFGVIIRHNERSPPPPLGCRPRRKKWFKALEFALNPRFLRQNPPIEFNPRDDRPLVNHEDLTNAALPNGRVLPNPCYISMNMDQLTFSPFRDMSTKPT